MKLCDDVVISSCTQHFMLHKYDQFKKKEDGTCQVVAWKIGENRTATASAPVVLPMERCSMVDGSCWSATGGFCGLGLRYLFYFL